MTAVTTPRCGSCRGLTRWADDAWVCVDAVDCGAEWYPEHGPQYAAPSAKPGDVGARLAEDGWRYLRGGRVRHLLYTSPYEWKLDAVLCGKAAMPDNWHGTGSQEEYEKLASLPICASCLRAGAG